MQATLIHGANLQIDFGISDGHPTATMLDWLRGMKKLAISSYEPGKRVNVRQLIDIELEWGREYDIVLGVHGSSVKSFIDGEPVSDVTIEEDLTGTISLGTYGPHAIARFRDPKVSVAGAR